MITVAVCFGVAQPGAAAPIKVKPTSTSAIRDCRPGAGSTCTGAPVALRSGALAVNASITSPLAGAAPGQGFNADTAIVRAGYNLRRAVRSLPISATVRIDSASSTHSGALFTAQPESATTGFAGTNLEFSVTKFGCDPSGCSGIEYFVWRDLTDATGPTAMRRRIITFKTVLTPMFSFGPKPSNVIRPGRIDISVRLGGATRLGGCANVMCYGPYDPLACAVDAGCVVNLAFPDGCVDPSCAVRVPRGCVDPACTAEFPPYGCLDPDCNVYYPPGGCLDMECNVYYPPYGCVDPVLCAVAYPFTLWCLDIECPFFPVEPPDDLPARQELADTGIARASARGFVTGIYVG